LIDTVVSIIVSTNAHHPSLPPRILQVRRPLVHQVLTFRGKSR
jgi:hypothetical protein